MMDFVDSSQPKAIPDWPWVVNRVHDQLPQDGICTAFPSEIQHRTQTTTNGDLNVNRRWLVTWPKPVGTYTFLILNRFVVKKKDFKIYIHNLRAATLVLLLAGELGKFSLIVVLVYGKCPTWISTWLQVKLYQSTPRSLLSKSYLFTIPGRLLMPFSAM